MYLPQAISLPPPLGTEWDLFRYIHPSEEVELEPMVGTCSVTVPLSPCNTLAFEAGVQAQNRPVPGSDRSQPASLAIGVGPCM